MFIFPSSRSFCIDCDDFLGHSLLWKPASTGRTLCRSEDTWAQWCKVTHYAEMPSIDLEICTDQGEETMLIHTTENNVQTSRSNMYRDRRLSCNVLNIENHCSS